MRAIWLARLDKARPVVLLTREEVLQVRALVTVAPITSTVRGLTSEVLVGKRNGFDHDGAINLDLITTIPRANLIRPLGMLPDEQEPDLARAFHSAFDLAIRPEPIAEREAERVRRATIRAHGDRVVAHLAEHPEARRELDELGIPLADPS